MCGSQHTKEKKKLEWMPFAVWQALIDQLPPYRTIEINSEGEHTTHPDFLKMLDYLNMNGKFALKLNTNGMWRFPAQELWPLLNRNTYSLSFSMDGLKDNFERLRTGAKFDVVLENVREAISTLSRWNYVGLSYMATARNMGDVIPLLRLLPGIRWIFLNTLHVCTEEMVGESLYGLREEYQQCLEETQAYCEGHGISFGAVHGIGGEYGASPVWAVPGCSFPKYMYVRPTGDVFPCCNRYDASIGNVTESSWEEIVKQGRYRFDTRSAKCDRCYAARGEWQWTHHFINAEYYKLWENLG